MDVVLKFLSKWLGWGLATFAAAIVSLFLFWASFHVLFGTLYDYKNNEKDFHNRYSGPTPVSSEYDGQYLTHRLIKMDLDYGITTQETMRNALSNVSQYLKSVNATCPWQNTDEGTAAYVACANERLHDNFYYTPSVEVSNNYAIHRSDCDTNTYLMIDAMRMKGMEGYIVYAPGHAFLAWKDSFSNYNYQETTSYNNKGEPADLSIDWYTKTIDKSYYTPVNAPMAEQIYNALIYKKSKGRVNIDTLYSKNKENAFIADWYFYARDKQHKTTKTDAQLMLSLLHTDFTSTDKKMAVLNYLMRNKHKDKALVMLDNIPADKCGSECFAAGVELGQLSFIIFKKPFFIYDDYLSNHASSGKVKPFRNGIILFVMALLLAAGSLIVSVLNFKRIKSTGKV